MATSLVEKAERAWSGYLARVRERPGRVDPFPARPLLAMIERFRGRTVCLSGVHPLERVRDPQGREFAFVEGADGLVAVRVSPALLEKLPATRPGDGWEVVGRIAGSVAVFQRQGGKVRHHNALLVEAEAVAVPGAGAVIGEAGAMTLLPA